MMTHHNIICQLQAYGTEEKRQKLMYFFKTGKSQYGEGDQFLGVTVPEIRKVAKVNKDVSMEVLEQLLYSEWHEVRLCALLILVLQFEKADEAHRQTLVEFYLAHTSQINNWDLVDLSAYYILGTYLLDKSRERLYQLAKSPLLWDNRIAIVSTYAFIRKGDLDDTYALSTQLIHHPHDLMHKAVGWMLREAGKKDGERLYKYIDKYRKEMPRTMLRYAIEKFSADIRQRLMRRD